MSTPKTIVIDGEKFVRERDVTARTDFKGNIKICVLQRGFVLVGIYHEKDGQCVLTNSSIIRRYGTSKGLGQLASEGPLKDTILDKNNGEVQFDKLTLVFAIDVNASAWVGKL